MPYVCMSKILSSHHSRNADGEKSQTEKADFSIIHYIIVSGMCFHLYHYVNYLQEIKGTMQTVFFKIDKKKGYTSGETMAILHQMQDCRSSEASLSD